MLMRAIPSPAPLWPGGYYAGDPLHPTRCQEYGPLQLISSHYAVVKALIEPNVKGARVLEIGPGRGAWTRSFASAAEVHCVDALSAEHNGFWRHVGEDSRITYHQVTDTHLDEVPDEHFDFLFSFGAFCHMPAATREGYLRSMFAKARSGAMAVVMYADYDKLERSKRGEDLTMSLSTQGIASLIRFYVRKAKGMLSKDAGLTDRGEVNVKAGRFFHAGIPEMDALLRSIGWDVISPDIGLNLRDPIAVFRRP